MKAFNSEKFTRLAAIVLVALELALLPVIHLGTGGADVSACYLAIILIALFALVTLRGERDRRLDLIRLGIAFTLVADYFLVLADDSELEGVLAFIVVQIFYAAYLFVKEERRAVRIVSLAARGALMLSLVVAAFIVLGEGTDPLAVASVIYYGNLVLSCVFAFLLGRGERIFAIGLLLFAMCDIWIGLEVLFSSYLDSNLMDFVYNANYNLPWVFYQPSQVLIALRLCQLKMEN
ncbi:MAG: hypothetical protein IJW53_04120 [Clostridia bacterium]|nr:hypothetical protein [Clostridia bacterium]